MLKHFHPALFLGEPDLVVETEAVPPPSVPPTPTPKPEIAVHIAGAVKVPGVYYLATGARIHEAIEKAGGTTDRADVHSLNLAAIIRDGQQIDVPEIHQISDVRQNTPIYSTVEDPVIPISPDRSVQPRSLPCRSLHRRMGRASTSTPRHRKSCKHYAVLVLHWRNALLNIVKPPVGSLPLMTSQMSKASGRKRWRRFGLVSQHIRNPLAEIFFI